MAAVCRSGYYQQKATRHSPDLLTQAVKTLVQAFTLFRLDYCNSPFYGITEGSMSRLQCVQNAAARLVSGAQRYDHITPVLQPTGGFWLPVRRRVDFKMAILVYLSLSGMAPVAANCQLVSDKGSRQLRSATSRTSVVKRAYSNYRERYSASAGPKL